MKEQHGLLISKNNEKSTLDKASNGADSRWLQTDSHRMRVVTYPPQFEGDHICYKGHSIYVISGAYEMNIGDDTVVWEAGDAFIIPDGVPHKSINSREEEAKVVIFDNHT